MMFGDASLLGVGGWGGRERKGVKKQQHWDKGRKTKSSSIRGIEKKMEGGMSGKVGRRLKDGKVGGAFFW